MTNLLGIETSAPDRPHERSIAVIGGGAAGYFAAMTAAEEDPSARVTILEMGSRFLSKVKISGGGRCNVTHACFDPKELVRKYPRGSRELLGAFHRWQPRDTIEWFAQRGVELKTEPDGRMFPVTDESQTIIDAFMAEAKSAGVDARLGCGVNDIQIRAGAGFELSLTSGETMHVDKLCIATGSFKGSPLLASLQGLGHQVERPIPSLFAMDVKDPRLEGLAGLAVADASVRVHAGGNYQQGPVLITHRGLSGPAVLKLSAWEAVRFYDQDYRLEISVCWAGQMSHEQVRQQVVAQRSASGKSLIKNRPLAAVPKRLWERLVEAAGIEARTPWAQLSKTQENALVAQVTDARFQVVGKTTNKEEFVTCGGVNLKEVDFRRMESRIIPGLHFAGECLNIDGVTGGFNFQAAWTTGRIAGVAMAEHG